MCTAVVLAVALFRRNSICCSSCVSGPGETWTDTETGSFLGVDEVVMLRGFIGTRKKTFTIP